MSMLSAQGQLCHLEYLSRRRHRGCSADGRPHALHLMTRNDASRPAAPGRRRYPRLEIDGVLELRNVTLGVSLEVRDISLGGFRAISPRQVRPGDEHVLRVALPGELPRDLRVQVIHCRPSTGNRPPFVVGWQFAPDTMTARHVVAILDHLTQASTFQAPRP